MNILGMFIILFMGKETRVKVLCTLSIHRIFMLEEVNQDECVVNNCCALL